MAMSDNINKLVWGIFAIGALSVALLPAGWSTLTTQYNQEAATNNQTMNTVFSTHTSTTYILPQLSVIPGHLDQISTAAFTPGVFPLQVTLTGYGFGSTAPSSGQVNGKPAVSMTIGGQSFDSASGITIVSWSDSQIVFTLPPSFTQNPSGAISFSVYSTSNQNLATYTLDIPIVTVGNIQNTYVNGSTTITGNVQSSSGSAITNEPVVLTITAPDGTTQTVDTTTDGNGNFTTPYTPTQSGGYMVKAQCEDGVSNLYGKLTNITFDDVTLQTNIDSTDASPYTSSGDAQLTDNNNLPCLVAGNPSLAGGTAINYNAGDYLQAHYVLPSGYQGLKTYSNISDNMSGTADGTTLYMSAITSSGTQVDTINTPYGDTSQSTSWQLPNGTTGLNMGMEYTQPQSNNGWIAQYNSQVLLSPIGAVSSSGGTFDSQYVTMTEPQWSSNPSLGTPITIMGQITYKGKPVANQTVEAWQFDNMQSTSQPPTQFNVIDSSGQSVNQLSTTTDSNGDYTFTFTIPTSEPSGYLYGMSVSCDASESGAPLTYIS